MKTIVLQDHQIEAVLRDELNNFAVALSRCAQADAVEIVDAEDLANFRSYLSEIERLREALKS